MPRVERVLTMSRTLTERQQIRAPSSRTVPALGRNYEIRAATPVAAFATVGKRAVLSASTLTNLAQPASQLSISGCPRSPNRWTALEETVATRAAARGMLEHEDSRVNS